ncbi:MAG: HDOD domain-containing protein [Cycloclasticus sp.]|nr:HDOD domain-containing protein [Cycloclasticus sp.]
MNQFAFARQAILNRDLKIFGYELLYRNTDQTNNSPPITSDVLASALLDLGLKSTTNDLPAFVNMSYDDLTNDTLSALPKDGLILEILEDITPSTELNHHIQQLSNEGFTFALDDFVYTPEWDTLIELASIIKFDLTVTSFEENKALINKLKNKNITFLAEKVETYEEYQQYLDIGCDLFQGFFFCKPEIIKGASASANSPAKIKLIAGVNQPDISIDSLVSAVEQDPNLTLLLLKYLNSAQFSFPNPVEKIKQAVVVLGINGMKRWVTLLSLRSYSSKPTELMRTALVRAKLAELIAIKMKHTNPDSYFLAGLLSTIDAFTNESITSTISSMNLDPSINDALIYGKGEMGATLTSITQHEKNLDSAHANEIASNYPAACIWADEIMQSF